MRVKVRRKSRSSESLAHLQALEKPVVFKVTCTYVGKKLSLVLEQNNCKIFSNIHIILLPYVFFNQEELRITLNSPVA